MNAVPAAATVAVTAEVSHVFAERGLDRRTARIAALVEPVFLAEAGWDPVRRMLSPPPHHPLLGRPVCRAKGCSTTAMDRSRICAACQRRLAEHGLGEDEIASLPRSQPRRGPGNCVVDGCGREWVSSRAVLCRAHLDLQHELGITVAELVDHRRARPLPACLPCAVAACPRQRRHPDGLYCEAHQQRLRAAWDRDPSLDEHRWRLTEPAVGRGGQISLRGLPPLVVAQLLFGLQQRCLLDAVKTKEGELRIFCNELRRQQVSTISEYHLDAHRDQGYRAVVNTLTVHAGRALATPETEVGKDEWDLVVFGHHGTLSFTEISQRWLREAAKRWAADDLPRHRIRPGRRTSGGLHVRHHLGCLARLSESLRMRADHGEHPPALGRSDMEAFLNRLAYLESAGRITNDARIRACREVRAVLARVRAMGLTRPGAIAAGLGEDFTLGVSDIPDPPASGEAGRDLPPEIMRQVCAHLDELASTEMRTGIELAIDTGRRPEEICDLDHDCLARDADGLPVLVYNNYKANRPARRLPISEHTATLITVQQQRVRARFPHTPVAELKLLPTDRRNPDGTHAITGFSLAFVHRVWVTGMPVLRTADGVEFDKSKVVLYAYRHSFAQRHADAGVPIDVLRELMSHRKLDTTKRYYRVGDKRRRAAVDEVAAMQFDRHGNRIWRQAQAVLDAEHARRAVGEVAVPFGVCAEPSNVKAGGQACPFRFRCAGCDHFRTDVSYLPDLHAYLDDLLRNRERLRAASDLDVGALRGHAVGGGNQQDPAADQPHHRRARRTQARRTRTHRAGRHRRPPTPRGHARHAPHPPGPARPPPGTPRMTSNNTSAPAPVGAMLAGRRADSARRRQRVVKALNEAVTRGEEISVSGIARRAGVDRSFLYRHHDLLEQIHAIEAQPPTAGGGPTVSRASLQADLLAAQQRCGRMATRAQQLERRLSELLGEQTWHESGLGAPDDIDQLNQRITHLEQQIVDLRLQLAERDQDLDAARAANRELMTQLNASQK